MTREKETKKFNNTATITPVMTMKEYNNIGSQATPDSQKPLLNGKRLTRQQEALIEEKQNNPKIDEKSIIVKRKQILIPEYIEQEKKYYA